MRRREFFKMIGGVATCWALAAAAQRPNMPTIGVLVVGAPGSEKFWRIFREALRELGYAEGQSVRFEFRTDQGQAGRLLELAAELVRLKVDVIVAWFTPAGRKHHRNGWFGAGPGRQMRRTDPSNAAFRPSRSSPRQHS